MRQHVFYTNFSIKNVFFQRFAQKSSNNIRNHWTYNYDAFIYECTLSACISVLFPSLHVYRYQYGVSAPFPLSFRDADFFPLPVSPKQQPVVGLHNKHIWHLVSSTENTSFNTINSPSSHYLV